MFQGLLKKKNPLLAVGPAGVESKKTQWQLKSEIFNVSQQLAYDCSADEMLEHDTDLHKKQLVQGKRKRGGEQTKKPTPNKFTMQSAFAVLSSATVVSLLEASYYTIK